MAGYVPLTRQAHAGSFWRAPPDWRFAAEAGLVPCVISEAAALATAMPLVFCRQDDRWQLMALLRLQPQGPSPYVGPDGSWRASQIPQALRSYPFAAAALEDGRFALLVDAQSGLVGPVGDYVLFDAAGAPGPELTGLIQALEARGVALPLTVQAIEALEQVDLLTEMALPGAGETPLFAVDAGRLQALGTDDLNDLHRAHALGLAYVQIVSMHHLPWLRKATAHVGRAARHAREGGTQDDATAAFLSALTEAQGEDLQDPAAQFLSRLPGQTPSGEVSE